MKFNKLVAIIGLQLCLIQPVSAIEFQADRELLDWEQELKTYGDVTYQLARPNINWREKLLKEGYIRYSEGGVTIQSEIRDYNGLEYILSRIDLQKPYADHFKVRLAQDTYGGAEIITDMSQRTNAVMGLNASFYRIGSDRHYGWSDKTEDWLVMIDGERISGWETKGRRKPAILGFFEDGHLKPVEPGMSYDVLRAQGMRHTIFYAGHDLVRNGEIIPNLDKTKHPRQAIGYNNPGTYYLVTVSHYGRVRSAGLDQMGEIFHSLGIKNAYNLDGGGSTTLTVNGQLLNEVSGDAQRPVSDGIMFVP